MVISMHYELCTGDNDVVAQSCPGLAPMLLSYGVAWEG